MQALASNARIGVAPDVVDLARRRTHYGHDGHPLVFSAQGGSRHCID